MVLWRQAATHPGNRTLGLVQRIDAVGRHLLDVVADPCTRHDAQAGRPFLGIVIDGAPPHVGERLTTHDARRGSLFGGAAEHIEEIVGRGDLDRGEFHDAGPDRVVGAGYAAVDHGDPLGERAAGDHEG
jgi:hypothetical protein